MQTEAWVLQKNKNQKLQKKRINLKSLKENEVLLSTKYLCLEGNYTHALEGKPQDLFKFRNEDEIILGNSGVVMVEKCGSQVTSVSPGDVCILFCNGVSDDLGYPKYITAYDKVNSMGTFSKKLVLNEKEVLKIPKNSKFSLKQWAAFSLKFITAWSNWQVAYKAWKIQNENSEISDNKYVFSWGGGVGLAELKLAKLYGFNACLITSSPKVSAEAEKHNIQTINRLNGNQHIVNQINKLTNEKGANIFIDNIGVSTLKTTLKCMSREGVLTTSGWKSGGLLPISRPYACQNRHLHVYTHYATYEEGKNAMKFAIENSWMPEIHNVLCWEELPEILLKYNSGELKDYYTVVKV
ncbi:zinc-binding dehydrogenase [Staphylococcus gallinarum]|uniref:zinc-binding dehydrogenase n=1 Tax=Staphylococcus gallinarum TaxID=1293 RepID=UPI002DB63868|nr:zinc-binding dehydrogenase [Staphylococcus gallinarum]MEB7040089.1 zinc-binding dehydrogenase [Staphylococcus gallinarum]